MVNLIQYEILKELSLSDGYVNISGILSRFFPVDNTNEEYELRNQLGKLKAFLELLQIEGLIKYESFKMGHGNNMNGYAWLHNTEVSASITEKGKEAIRSRDLKPKEDMLLDLTISVHNSTLDMNVFMKKYIARQFWWPLAVSILALVVAISAIVFG